jgi:hypothetical protein
MMTMMMMMMTTAVIKFDSICICKLTQQPNTNDKVSTSERTKQSKHKHMSTKESISQKLRILHQLDDNKNVINANLSYH